MHTAISPPAAPRREWPRCRRTAEEGDELAALHGRSPVPTFALGGFVQSWPEVENLSTIAYGCL
jgi:hypothetical protein